MKVVVFGATGRVGKEVVEECLRRGYEVVAFSRKPILQPQKNLFIIYGDAVNPNAVDKAIQDSDAVIIALGVKPSEKRDIISAATANIISAMLHYKVKRLVCLSAYGVGESLREVPLISRLAFTTYLGRILRINIGSSSLSRQAIWT